MISTPIFHPYSKPCYVEPGNTRTCRHYGQSNMSSGTAVIVDSFGHPLRMRSAHFNPYLQYYRYITIFGRVYLHCCGSVTDEASYVYSRTHPYNGAIRRSEDTASSFPHNDVELRKFRVVVAVAMATVRNRCDSL